MTVPTSSVPERIVQKVAAETDADQLELLSLYDAIDTDALESVIETMADGEVSFSYSGTTVSVDNNGAIQITRNFITTSTDT